MEEKLPSHSIETIQVSRPTRAQVLEILQTLLQAIFEAECLVPKETSVPIWEYREQQQWLLTSNRNFNSTVFVATLIDSASACQHTTGHK